jgi:hypothetical protein
VEAPRTGSPQDQQRTLPISPFNRGTARRLTAGLRQWPDFVIIGAQRAGTTSLMQWIVAQPTVRGARTKELHYFDLSYAKGQRWYRSNFPLRHRGQVTGESTPYMLYHPLSPERAASDLPPTTRFIALLRDPVQRALSQYWLNRRRQHETETFPVAIESEQERLTGQEAVVLRGQRSLAHQRFSYAARGQYAEQLERWYTHVGRDRILVVQSELLFTSNDTANSVLDWLGLAASDLPFPKGNAADRLEAADPDVMARLHRHFDPYNQQLEDLLGRRLWRP